MPQAIRTIYKPATNHNPSRIIANTDGKRLIRSWDYALDTQGNHDNAARQLATELEWLEDGDVLISGWHNNQCFHLIIKGGKL